MAAEPSKTEIQTLFKRLRAAPANKVAGRCRAAFRSSEPGCFPAATAWAGPGPRCAPGRVAATGRPGRGLPGRGEGPGRAAGPRGTGPPGCGGRWRSGRAAASAGPSLCLRFSRASTAVPRTRAGPASPTGSSCASTAPASTGPWASTSASSGAWGGGQRGSDRRAGPEQLCPRGVGTGWDSVRDKRYRRVMASGFTWLASMGVSGCPAFPRWSFRSTSVGRRHVTFANLAETLLVVEAESRVWFVNFASKTAIWKSFL